MFFKLLHNKIDCPDLVCQLSQDRIVSKILPSIVGPNILKHSPVFKLSSITNNYPECDTFNTTLPKICR